LASPVSQTTSALIPNSEVETEGKLMTVFYYRWRCSKKGIRNFSKLINTWAADKDIIIICLMTMLFSLFINAKRFEE
jgi:hypothetical protein